MSGEMCSDADKGSNQPQPYHTDDSQGNGILLQNRRVEEDGMKEKIIDALWFVGFLLFVGGAFGYMLFIG